MTSSANSLTVLDSIGNTPLVELRRIVPRGSARVLLKLESANQTGSMKDRVARAMVGAALADGRLTRDGTVMEYTGGSTGASLALVCAAHGIRCKLVSSDAFSNEKLATMRAFGAELVLIPNENRMQNAALFRAMIAKAEELSNAPGHWWCNQLNNRDGAAGYHGMGEEIWYQSGGRVDAFVQVVGTAHSLHGTTDALRRHNSSLHVTAVEPAESPVLSGGAPGSHRIEGIGLGFTPPLFERDKVSDITSVSTAEANAMARRLAAEEAIFGGTSTGANVVAALRVAADLGAGATVATLVVDSGLRYLSSDVF